MFLLMDQKSTRSRSDGEVVYLHRMTQYGPTYTTQIEKARSFPTRQQAEASEVYINFRQFIVVEVPGRKKEQELKIK